MGARGDVLTAEPSKLLTALGANPLLADMCSLPSVEVGGGQSSGPERSPAGHFILLSFNNCLSKSRSPYGASTASTNTSTRHNVNSITQTVSTTSCVGCNGVISGGGSGGLFTVLGEMHCMQATHNDLCFSNWLCRLHTCPSAAEECGTR